MGFQPTEWVYHHSRSVGAGRAVLLAIAWFADNDTWEAWPSVNQLAEMNRFSRATAFRGIADVKALGELDITPGRGRGNPSRYVLNPKRSQPETLPDEKRSQKGLKSADKRSHSCDQNSHEPMNHANAEKRSQPETHYKRSQPDTLSHPQPPTPPRCPTCQHPTWDCTCGQPAIGPTAIRDALNGLRREDPPGGVR